MTSILVTGSNGYIGRHVVEKLARAGAHVIAIDMNSPEIEVPGVTYITANLFDPDFDVEEAIGFVPDTCLHLAWRNGFKHNDPSHMEDLSGHYAFLKKLMDAGVGQIAVMGSMHEVGYWEGAIDEDSPCNPQSLYAIAKDALRRALFLTAEDTDTKVQWLRGFYIYGDDAAAQSIFGKIFRAAQAGEKHFPFTTGKNLYDYITVDELTDQISAAVMQDDVIGIINCCSGSPVSLADQVESYIAENGLDIVLDYGAFPDRPYDSPGVWGDATKIDQIMQAKQAND